MKPSHGCYDIIRRFEGFSPVVYCCPAGVNTIGYGHALRSDEVFTNPITEEDAYMLLRKDVVYAATAVQRFIPIPLTQSRYDALVSFTFNVGAGALQRSTLRQVLLREEYHAAPPEFRRWVYAGGKKLAGLMRRREAEIAVFQSNPLPLKE
jgi:lysozyme